MEKWMIAVSITHTTCLSHACKSVKTEKNKSCLKNVVLEERGCVSNSGSRSQAADERRGIGRV